MHDRGWQGVGANRKCNWPVFGVILHRGRKADSVSKLSVDGRGWLSLETPRVDGGDDSFF